MVEKLNRFQREAATRSVLRPFSVDKDRIGGDFASDFVAQ